MIPNGTMDAPNSIATRQPHSCNCRSLSHAASEATGPIAACDGVNASPTIATPMSVNENTIAGLRRIRSPMPPITIAPIGRVRKPAPRVARVASRAADGLSPG
jgi:hypothetical protein